MLSIVNPEQQEVQDLSSNLDEIARQGAKRMLIEALQQEVAEYVGNTSEERDESGKALVVRNGKARPRKVTLGAGVVEVEAPRINDRRAEHRCSSKILPPYLRKSPKRER